MSAGSVACIMKCNFTYVKSGNEEFLEGEYTSTYEKTSTAEGIKKGGNCGGGRIFLRKVPTSDFYIEPFLRDNPVVKTPPATKPPATNPPVAKSKTPPAKTSPTKTPPAKNPPAVAKKTTPAKTPDQKTTVTKPKTTEIEQPKTEITKTEAPKTIDAPKVTIPVQTRARTNELTKTLTVTNEEITVKLYDNGEIDGDTISVYLDNKPILSNKLLTAAPITIQLKMDESNPEHVLIMVAENMGRIPPNTSLMIVQDGETRHEVRITSTEQKNAMVRFRYQKSTP